MSTGAESLRVRRLGGDRAAGRSVLAIQDTTVIRSEGGGGLYLHPVLAVDADDKAILELAHGGFLSRTSSKKADRRSKPVADKEANAGSMARRARLRSARARRS